MKLVLQPAVKTAKPLKVLMYGPTYSGKTYGAIKLAVGIIMEMRKCKLEEAYKRILLADTEYGRGRLYAGEGQFNYFELTPPYTVAKLNEFLVAANMEESIDVIIIDSFTHFWSKKGGILEQKLIKDQQGGNSYTNWNGLTQDFNDCVDNILASPKVIICTLRAKSDVVLADNGNGKMAPKTYGLKPDSRDGIDFEFDIVINVDKDNHSIILDKGIPGLDLTYDPITPELGQLFYKTSMDNAIKVERTKEDYINTIRGITRTNPSFISNVQLKLSGRKLDDLTLEQLKELEVNLIKDIKKAQSK